MTNGCVTGYGPDDVDGSEAEAATEATPAQTAAAARFKNAFVFAEQEEEAVTAEEAVDVPDEPEGANSGEYEHDDDPTD